MSRIKEEHFKVLENLTLRSFEPRRILDILIPEDIRLGDYIDWGVHTRIGIVNNIDNEIGGVVIKLNHENYTDCLFITMSFLNFLNLYFIDRHLKIIHKIENVPFENAFDVINEQLKMIVKVPFNFSLN